MSNMVIVNKVALDAWIHERRRMGHDIIGVKGDPPEGARYSDGDLILQHVNVAMKDAETGEIFSIEREVLNS